MTFENEPRITGMDIELPAPVLIKREDLPKHVRSKKAARRRPKRKRGPPASKD